jgi:hypothetical protein
MVSHIIPEVIRIDEPKLAHNWREYSQGNLQVLTATGVKKNRARHFVQRPLVEDEILVFIFHCNISRIIPGGMSGSLTTVGFVNPVFPFLSHFLIAALHLRQIRPGAGRRVGVLVSHWRDSLGAQFPVESRQNPVQMGIKDASLAQILDGRPMERLMRDLVDLETLAK